MRGIIIIASGHPFYGKMASTLAASIKYTSDIPVCLFYHGRALAYLKEAERKLFSDIIEIKDKDIMVGDKVCPFKTKTRVYDLTPFTETIYIDADTLWMPRKSADQLFDELSDVPFTMISEGSINLTDKTDTTSKMYTMWADPKQIGEKYGVTDGMICQLRSEFMYFHKSKENRKYFTLVKKIYDNPKLAYIELAGQQPDELAFIIAGAVLQHHPHREKYTPVYWRYMNRNIDRKTMMDTFYLMSMGGNTSSPDQKKTYNDLANNYLKKSGLLPFRWVDKKIYLRERTKM